MLGTSVRWTAWLAVLAGVLFLLMSDVSEVPEHNASSESIATAFVPIPHAIAARGPHVDGLDAYRKLEEEAARDWEGFWMRHARELIAWQRAPTVVYEGDFAQGRAQWFRDGQLNVAYNCVDRHAAASPNKVAILWEGDEVGTGRQVTFSELQQMCSQVAHYLVSRGVQRGDAIAIYMPMVPETLAAMLACARIGAMHNVVFAGFSAEALADRIADSKAKILLTADQGVRGGRPIPLKETSDAALARCAGQVHTVLVYARTGAEVSMVAGRDEAWAEVIPRQPVFLDPVAVDAEHPLFMLYTSGSTGRPKGVVHTSAGYLLYASMTQRLTFDHHEGDVFGCLADVGWITGHSYIVYGPLCNGATTVLFESTPVYPTPSRYWDVVARLKITQLYTAPTVVRALKKFGDAPLAGYDLSSLRVLGSVGEPISPEAWTWYHEKVGGGRCAVVDTYWQTETGGHVIAPMPGAVPTKPGSATLPFPGISLAVLDQHTGAVLAEDGVEGVLVISRPWPGMARTIFGDHEKFLQTYFRPYAGVYFTGDRVHRDADGYYWIRGRVDGTRRALCARHLLDVINVSGHRLSTAEIESALGKHPMCAEAAVLGRPDDITGYIRTPGAA